MTKSSLNKNLKWAAIGVIVAWFFGVLAVYLRNANFAVLSPAGEIAVREKRLMVITVALAMLVIIPVFIMTAVIAWRYREGNHKAKYSPELSGNWQAETVWWGIPSIIILALSIITWNTSHSLAPNKALASSVKPLSVQVVALDWKWLFIYPEQGTAAVNQMAVPVGTPVEFNITADAPMNAFWVPQLGSQIYAMPGMATRLNLIADRPGDYAGSSANISGRGFTGMNFTVLARSNQQFNDWLQAGQQSPHKLDMAAYKQLSKPSVNNSVAYYSDVESGLFEKILNKYLAPENSDAR